MLKKIRRSVVINGVKNWISADTEQEYAERVVKLFSAEAPAPQKSAHDFGKYAWEWYEIFSKPNVSYVTGLTYRRQLQYHILPAFQGKAIEEITTADVQSFFNGMGDDVTKATKNKARSVLNMIFNQALDDGLIAKNPLNSRNLRIKGKASAATLPYSVENMQFLLAHLDCISSDRDRAYIALAALHPLRPEEVLGLQWQDIDLQAHTIHIRRAVTHPSRNLGMVGEPKTEASKRTIALVPQIEKYLRPGPPQHFVLGGERSLSYVQVRRMCARIQRETGFPEPIQPRRFRTTVLTDIYDATKDIKSAQAAAGHTTAAMTLKYLREGPQRNQRHRRPNRPRIRSELIVLLIATTPRKCCSSSGFQTLGRPEN